MSCLRCAPSLSSQGLTRGDSDALVTGFGRSSWLQCLTGAVNLICVVQQHDGDEMALLAPAGNGRDATAADRDVRSILVSHRLSRRHGDL